MRKIKIKTKVWKGVELIAVFGQAKLWRCVGHRFVLHGGSDADRMEANEWVSLFLHEAAPRVVALDQNCFSR